MVPLSGLAAVLRGEGRAEHIEELLYAPMEARDLPTADALARENEAVARYVDQ